jgi:hypothetical protein
MKYPFLLILLLILSQYSCQSPTEPIQNSPPDTTSNNFTFQTFTFGASNAGSSHLSDVAIISDTNIWCVGAVYLDSTNGVPDPNAYNAVHWNGSNWELKKIQFYTFCGQQQTGSYPVNAVVSLGDSVVWIASINSQIAILNGGRQTKIMCVPVSVSKMWAANINEVYTVGSIGQIGHYQNGSWQKIASGTSLDIQDIWGANNPASGEEEILAVASDPGVSFDRAILNIQGNMVTRISDNPIAYTLQGVWFVPGKHYYVVGSGIYEKGLLSDNKWADSVLEFTQYYTTCVRGNGVNDVFVGGSFGELLHWNGASWKSYRETTALTNGSYGSIAVKGNLVVAVGESLEPGDLDTKAVITIGHR